MSQLTNLLAQVDISVGDGEDQVNIPTADISQNSVSTALEVVFGVLGMVAFLVIVIAGMRFVLSRGDPDKSAKARNTVIYAAVGLVIAISAFTLVRFITNEVG